MVEFLSDDGTHQNFDAVVLNAIDFLEVSVEQLELKPKLSVLSFAIALELFLTARLIREHWSLCLEDPKSANFASFKSGDVKTIGCIAAIERLEGLRGSGFAKYKDAFKPIIELRNSLIHFYNAAYSSGDEKAVQDATAKQLVAWHYLFRLLMDDWESEFRLHLSDLKKLNEKISANSSYLKVKFELKEDVLRGKNLGGLVEECPFCGYSALCRDNHEVGLTSYRCEVCEYAEELFQYKCEECSRIHFIFPGVGPCSTKFCRGSAGELQELMIKSGVVIGNDVGQCGGCSYGIATVVIIDDVGICLNCGEYYNAYLGSSCDHCNELNFGKDLQFSRLTGCLGCDGHKEFAGLGQASLSTVMLHNSLNSHIYDFRLVGSKVPEGLVPCAKHLRKLEAELKRVKTDREMKINIANEEVEPEVREATYEKISSEFDEAQEAILSAISKTKEQLSEILEE